MRTRGIDWLGATNARTNGLSRSSLIRLIEMATTHSELDVNRAYVDVLLTNVICGSIVTVSSADRNIYVRRLCRCAALLNDFFVICQISTTCILSKTSKTLQISEGLEYHCLHRSTHIKIYWWAMKCQYANTPMHTV